MNLVTSAECAAHLRLDSGADDPWLDIFIPAVSGAVALWLKEEWRLYEVERNADGTVAVDSNGDPIYILDTNGDYIRGVA